MGYIDPVDICDKQESLETWWFKSNLFSCSDVPDLQAKRFRKNKPLLEIP